MAASGARHPPDEELGLALHLPGQNDAALRGGATHVEGKEVHVIDDASQNLCRYHPSCRPRLKSAGGPLRCRFQRHDSAT